MSQISNKTWAEGQIARVSEICCRCDSTIGKGEKIKGSLTDPKRDAQLVKDKGEKF